MARKGSGKERLGEPTLTASDWAEGALQLRDRSPGHVPHTIVDVNRHE